MIALVMAALTIAFAVFAYVQDARRENRRDSDFKDHLNRIRNYMREKP